MKITKRFLSGRKKWIITGLSAFVLVMTAALYLIVTLTNSDASKSIDVNRQAVISATTNLNTKLADSTLPNSEKTKLINQYSLDIASYLEATCGPQRGQFYSYLLPSREKCKASREAIQTLGATTDSIYTFMTQEEELAAAIPSPAEGLSFQQSYDTWAQATEKVTGIDVSSRLDATKTALVSALTGYRDAWKALVDADAAKNKNGFSAAKESLSGAYKTLQGAPSGLSEPLTSLVDEFEANFGAYLRQTD